MPQRHKIVDKYKIDMVIKGDYNMNSILSLFTIIEQLNVSLTMFV